MSSLNLSEQVTQLLDEYYANSTAIESTFRSDLVNELFEYPLLKVFTKSDVADAPEGTLMRNLHFVIGHCGFFLFNFINFWTVLLVFGFVLGRLRKNRLLQYALLAFLIQMTSCGFSITRYSINDEFGNLALWSNVTGILAYIFRNVIECHVFFNNHPRKTLFVRIGIAIWVLLGLAVFVFADLLFWDTLRFKLIRIYFSLSTVFQLLAYIRALWALGRGDIQLRKDVPLQPQTVRRILQVCIFSIVVALAVASSGFPVFQYPATGSTFSVMLVAVSVLGEMDFMQDDKNNNNDDESTDGDDDDSLQGNACATEV